MSKSYIPIQWKTDIIKRQRGLCASKNCAKNHNTTKKQKIDLYSNFDHIRPEAMNGKNIPSNIQALCPKCHTIKTREDREKIKKWKEQQEAKNPYQIKIEEPKLPKLPKSAWKL